MATEQMQVYAGREEVKELGVRLQNFMPNAQQFSNAEAQAVAQIAIAHRLDPFNGEVWGIKGDGKWYGVMVGIKGLRKCANRAAKEEETIYWKEFINVAPSKYGEPDTSVVFECVLRDTITMQAYAKSITALVNAQVPYKEAVEMLGPAPRTVGIGIATPAERSKMKITQRAKKRAEADAIKQRFDVEFGAGVIAEGDKEAVQLTEIAETAGLIVDGETEYVTDEHSQVETKAEKRSTQSNIDVLYGTGAGAEADIPATDAPKYKASGTKIVGIVADIIGCDPPEAAKIILAKFTVSEMITEQQAREFAQGKLQAA